MRSLLLVGSVLSFLISIAPLTFGSHDREGSCQESCIGWGCACPSLSSQLGYSASGPPLTHSHPLAVNDIRERPHDLLH